VNIHTLGKKGCNVKTRILASRGTNRYHVHVNKDEFVTRGHLFLSAALVCLLPARSSAQFEGIIETANVSTDEYGKKVSFIMTMWVAPTGVRITIPPTGAAPGVTIIGRSDRSVRWVLNDSDKTYFELPIEVPPEDETRLPEPAGFQRTGKKKSIHGYHAEQLLLKHGTLETEIWATGELRPLVDALAKAMGGGDVEGGGPWSNELTRAGLFPLKAQTRENNVVLESSDVTKLLRTRIDRTLMELPAGYTKHGVGDVIRDETSPGP
jgi:hypothetical protein